MEHREDRRKLLVHQIKLFLRSLPKPEYFLAKKHEMGGVYGCKDSHLKVLRQAQQTLSPTTGTILILEDDVVFNKKVQPDQFPAIPTHDWDILFLGHNLQQIFADQIIPPPNSPPVWLRAEYALTTHAYIVNHNSINKLIHLIENGDIKTPIDVLYAEAMQQQKIIGYAYHPMLAVQLDDNMSDVEQKVINYKHVLYKPMIQTCPFKLDPQTKQMEMILKQHPKHTLPRVSIVMLHHNRPEFILQMWHNIKRQDYPKHLIQWIIIDDSSGYDFENLMPADMKAFPGICYMKMGATTIPIKRNLGCKMATNNIIIQMDDDDVYLEQHISRLVNVLMDFPHINCVGSTHINCYDLITGTSFRASTYTTEMAEATMAFRKKFWETRQYNEGLTGGEGIYFTRDRYSQCMQIPCSFLMYAITHGKNITTSRTMAYDKIIPAEHDFWPDIPLDARVIMSKIKQAKLKQKEEARLKQQEEARLIS